MDLDCCDDLDEWNQPTGLDLYHNDRSTVKEETYITGIYMNQTSNPILSADRKIDAQKVKLENVGDDTKAIADDLEDPQNEPLVEDGAHKSGKGSRKLKIKPDKKMMDEIIPQDSVKTKRKGRKLQGSKTDDSKVVTKEKSEGSSEAKPRSFPCDYCSEIFKRMHQRDEHIKETHAEYYGRFVCLLCQKDFDSRHILYQHKLRTHEPVGEFICPVCGSKFAKQSGLKRHLQIHSDNPKWVCSYCARSSFLSKGDMERHIRSKHTGERPYACKYEGCDRRFTNSGDRAKHYLHHTGEKRFQCTVCGLKMHTSGELKQHTWIHTGERPYICTVCGEGFRQPFRLKMHTRIHTGEKPFQCETCGKAFSDKVYLKRHEAIHKEERAHVCPQCGKTFKHDSNMRRHVATAHDKKFPYMCQQCGVGCQGRDEFKRHKAKHNGARAFNCPVCNKGFYTQEDVNSHVKVVHNVVKSRCSKCGALFKDLRSHKAHLVKIHNVSEESAGEETQEAKKMKKDKESQAMVEDGIDEDEGTSAKIWYTCNMCHKDFSFFKTLPKHYVKVHNLTWEEARNIANEEKILKDGQACEAPPTNGNCEQTFSYTQLEGVASAAVVPTLVSGIPAVNFAQLTSFTPIVNSVNIQSTSGGVIVSKQMRSNPETDTYDLAVINNCDQLRLQLTGNSNV